MWRCRDPAQWITNRAVNGDSETDYVYGRLRQDILNVNARATYAFHRDMTLEIFLQPFVAVGRYSAIRRLAKDSAVDVVAPPDDPSVILVEEENVSKFGIGGQDLFVPGRDRRWGGLLTARDHRD